MENPRTSAFTPAGAWDDLLQFAEKHGESLQVAFRRLDELPPGFSEPADSRLVTILRLAADHPHVFTMALRTWLKARGIAYPKGVFIWDESRRPKGRPPDVDKLVVALKIREERRKGQSWSQLAKRYEPDAYRKSTKRAADLVRRRVARATLFEQANRRKST